MRAPDSRLSVRATLSIEKQALHRASANVQVLRLTFDLREAEQVQNRPKPQILKEKVHSNLTQTF